MRNNAGVDVFRLSDVILLDLFKKTDTVCSTSKPLLPSVSSTFLRFFNNACCVICECCNGSWANPALLDERLQMEDIIVSAEVT